MRIEQGRMLMDRKDFLRIGGTGLAGAVLLGGASAGAFARTGSLGKEFGTAAQKYRVPVELLLAMGFVNTLWEMPPPSASDYDPGDLSGRGAYGIMQLMQNPWADTLARAAALTGLSQDALKTSRPANIRGGAAVLAEMQGKERPRDVGFWQRSVSEYGGGALYAEQVYETLRDGASTTISTGERVELAPHEGVEVPQTYSASSTPDYKRAKWRPAYGGNYTNSNRERSVNISRIVVHVVEGSYSSAISWFQNPSANVSAHYVVSRRGAVAQSVRDADIAWHAGNWVWNTHSIGIEHEGYTANRSTWTNAMYHASARLAAHMCDQYDIPVDNKHVVGHRQVPKADHTDPGRYFNYQKYRRLIRYYKNR